MRRRVAITALGWLLAYLALLWYGWALVRPGPAEASRPHARSILR